MKKNLITATPQWREDRELWQLNVQKDRVRKSFYSSTKGKKGSAECLQKAQKWLDTACDGDPVIADAWEQFVAHKRKTVAEAGLTLYTSFYKKWLSKSDVVKRRLSKATDYDWQDVLDKCKDENLSQRTISNFKAVIIDFLKFCKGKKWTENVPEGLTVSSNKGKKKKVILQPSGIKTVFTVDTYKSDRGITKEWYINFFRLAIITGMRRGELAGLQWSDISDNKITISRSINSLNIQTDGKNENARRTVPLPPSAVDVLNEQKELLKASGIVTAWVFPDKYGSVCNPNYVYECWKRYLSSNGLDERITMHNLRRTMISLHKADEMPLELLKQVVGHSASMDTFGVYGEEVDGEMTLAASFMEDSIKNIIG